MNRSYSKIKHIQESNMRLERRLINEQVTGDTQIKSVVTKSIVFAEETDIINQMVIDPPFEGTYSGVTFGGVFKGVDWRWDCNMFFNMVRTRELYEGKIMVDTLYKIGVNINEIEKTIPNTDPESIAVMFRSNDRSRSFFIYKNINGTMGCYKL